MSEELAEYKTQAPAKRATTADLLQGDQFKARIAAALPRHITPDRMIAVGLTAINRTPLLAKCSQTSFFQAMLNLSQMGLEPDGRQAHLIPFRNNKTNTYEVQLIVDYKGLVHMARKSGEVSRIHADVICENDDFEYNMGRVEKHKIDLRKPRGKVYAAYAVCTFKDGTEQAEVMSRDEIDNVRKRSKAGQSGPWVTDYNEMAKKTVFRRLSKWLPMSSEYRDALSYDDDSNEPLPAIGVDVGSPPYDVATDEASAPKGLAAKARAAAKAEAAAAVKAKGNAANKGNVEGKDEPVEPVEAAEESAAPAEPPADDDQQEVAEQEGDEFAFDDDGEEIPYTN